MKRRDHSAVAHIRQVLIAFPGISTMIPLLLSLVLVACLVAFVLRRASGLPFPPGPTGYPIIGAVSGTSTQY